MATSIKKPAGLTEEHLEYLDDLRGSGVTNMYGAAPFLVSGYPELSKKEAREILGYWMDTFSERHKEGKLC